MADLRDRLRNRDRAAVSEALNLVDDQRPARRADALALLDALERETDALERETDALERETEALERGNGAPRPTNAARIGVTGAPGAGKSTLLDALVRVWRGRDETVGIIAVDPSSQRTGGALLGDRIRVRSGARDPGVFLRSMAARDRLGGLADATRAGMIVLASVFDRVVVETVGVGQSESDVASLVDTLVFVAEPGAGDLLQFMKAGVLELPDLFVVNKADRGPMAERTAHELEAGLGLGERPAEPAGASGTHSGQARWTPPVVLVSARDGQGVPALAEALDAHRAALGTGDVLTQRRRRGRDAFVRTSLRDRYGSHGVEALGGAAALTERLTAEPGASGFGLALALGREIEAALCKPAS